MANAIAEPSPYVFYEPLFHSIVVYDRHAGLLADLFPARSGASGCYEMISYVTKHDDELVALLKAALPSFEAGRAMNGFLTATVSDEDLTLLILAS